MFMCTRVIYCMYKVNTNLLYIYVYIRKYTTVYEYNLYFIHVICVLKCFFLSIFVIIKIPWGVHCSCTGQMLASMNALSRFVSYDIIKVYFSNCAMVCLSKTSLKYTVVFPKVKFALRWIYMYFKLLRCNFINSILPSYSHFKQTSFSIHNILRSMFIWVDMKCNYKWIASISMLLQTHPVNCV